MTQTTIRQATEEDVFDILVLAKEFSKEAPKSHKWDKDKTENFIISAIDSNFSTILVLENEDGVVGAMVCVLNEMYMSQTIQAVELAWFVSREYRGKRGSILLIKAFEEWAKKGGASYCMMSDITELSSLEKLYNRIGYSKSETTYIKEL